MKMHRCRQGQIRVLEAFLAVIVVFGALLLSRPFYVSYDGSADQEILYSIGMNALMHLDQDGDLGRLISQRNWTEISSRLSILLPIGFSYNLTVYDEELNILNDSPIFSGDLNAKSVVSIQYVIVDRKSLDLYIVRLQLAWVK